MKKRHQLTGTVGQTILQGLLTDAKCHRLECTRLHARAHSEGMPSESHKAWSNTLDGHNVVLHLQLLYHPARTRSSANAFEMNLLPTTFSRPQILGKLRILDAEENFLVNDA